MMVPAAFVKAISKGRSRGFVYDTAHIETGYFTSFLGGLALGIVEIGRNGYHRFGHFLPEVVLRCFLHFLKYHGRKLLRGVQPAIDVDTHGVVVTLYYFVTPMTDFFRYL